MAISTRVLGSLLALTAVACGDSSGSSGKSTGDGGFTDPITIEQGDGGAGPVGGKVTSLDGVWVATSDPGQLLRFAPGANTPTDTIELDDWPRYVEIVDGVAFYISHSLCSPDFCSTVHYHDLKTGKAGEIPLAAQSYTGSMAYADGSLWVADEATDALWRINPATKEVVGGVKLGLHGGDQYDGLEVSAAGDEVFVASFFGSNAVARVSMASQEVLASGGVGDGTTGIAATSDAVWTTARFDGTLRRLNRSTLKVDAFVDLEADISAQVRNVAVIGSDVWVVTGKGGNAQAICCEVAKPGLFRVAADTMTMVSYLPLEEPGGLRAHGSELWAKTAKAALQIDTAQNKVARTLTPKTGTVTDVAFPETGGGTGSTQGRSKIDVYSVVEPPPAICEDLDIAPSFGPSKVYGTGTATLTLAGTASMLTGGTCQTLRDDKGKVVQYLAVFANGLTDAKDRVVVTVDAYKGDGAYKGALSWEIAGKSSSNTPMVTISQTGLHGSATFGSDSLSFDCQPDSAVGIEDAVPAPPAVGEAVVQAATGRVYRYVNVLCQRTVLGNRLEVRAPKDFAEGDFYSFTLKSSDPAVAGPLDGSVSFSYFGKGVVDGKGASLTLACGDTISGTFETEDKMYKGAFNCRK